MESNNTKLLDGFRFSVRITLLIRYEQTSIILKSQLRDSFEIVPT